MEFFGIGPLNLILILGVMLIVFGPERLPEMAAKAGRLVRDLRAYASDMTGEFSGELTELRQQFDGVQDEMRTLGSDLQTTTAEVGASVREATAGVSDLGRTSRPSAVTGVNETPPPDKVVPLTPAPIRPRVEDYKPGS